MISVQIPWELRTIGSPVNKLPDPTSEAVQFFYDNAGGSYRPATETPEEGRQRAAVELAKAEAWAKDHAEFVWQDDQDGDHSYLAEDEQVESCEECGIQTDDGYESWLCCIDDATPEYRRVIEAGLALEAVEAGVR